MFATLIGAGGAFLYSKHIELNRTKALTELDTEIANFNEADMRRVQDFDSRLRQAVGRVNSSVSVVSIFNALEAATIDTVKIKTLGIERQLDDAFLLTVAIETDTFDSTIFQRDDGYRSAPAISSVTIKQLSNSGVASGNTVSPGASSDEPLVTFTAELEVPVEAVPYEVNLENITQSSPGEAVVEENNQLDI